MAKRASKQEQQWQADSDVETILRYQELQQDKNRMSRAIKAAQAKAEEYQKQQSRYADLSRSLTGRRNNRKNNRNARAQQQAQQQQQVQQEEQ